MMAGKPIVMSIIEPEPIPLKANCAIFYEDDNSQSLADKIKAISRLSDTERNAMGQRGHEYVIKHHPYPTLAAKFLNNIK